MDKSNPDPQHYLKILQALDKAIESDSWNETPFLKATKKKLKQIRDRFKQELQLDELTSTRSGEKAKVPSFPSEKYCLLYLSLYNADGDNLKKWERILSLLPTYTNTRPIYNAKKNIEELIRSKQNKHNEGYVSVYVERDNILPAVDGKPLVDKLNNELVSLKDKSLMSENIAKFVHVSGQYVLKDKQLHREDTEKG